MLIAIACLLIANLVIGFIIGKHVLKKLETIINITALILDKTAPEYVDKVGDI
jgi:hypothetical protein